MVKRLRLRDKDNYLMLTAGYLYDLRTLRGRLDQFPAQMPKTEWHFHSSQEATAWMLTAMCRCRSFGRYYREGSTKSLMEAPLHTWLFGPPATPTAAIAD